VVPAQGVPMLIAGALHRLADVVSGERHEEKVSRHQPAGEAGTLKRVTLWTCFTFFTHGVSGVRVAAAVSHLMACCLLGITPAAVLDSSWH